MFALDLSHFRWILYNPTHMNHWEGIKHMLHVACSKLGGGTMTFMFVENAQMQHSTEKKDVGKQAWLHAAQSLPTKGKVLW